MSVVATNTMLASASGALLAFLVTWKKYGRPDPSMSANGMATGSRFRRHPEAGSGRREVKGATTMKLITAIIRPEKLEDVKVALFAAEVEGLTIQQVSGHGGEKAVMESYRGHPLLYEFHAHGTAQKLKGLTLTPEFKVTAHTVLRGDLRVDWSDVDVFQKSGGAFTGSQPTILLNGIYVF